jgi:glycosyltransferase involved in cell wall biosynthesis
MVKCSVIICAHNPNRTTFRRVLESLIVQTLEHSAWELLLVDNASEPSIQEVLQDFRLPLRPRIIQENKMGLTVARITGIKAAKGEVLVLVDDDTILKSEYLENAFRFMQEHPAIGVAGGRIHGEFEVEPKAWQKQHLGILAIRDFGDRPIQALISNMPGPWVPCGAGMVIRAAVANKYASMVTEKWRLKLDRVGNSLSSCGDSDMAYTSADMGLFMAYEPSLVLTHVIPKTRLTFRYLLSLSYSIQRDGWLLKRIRDGEERELSWWQFWSRMLLLPFRTVTIPPQRWLLHIAEHYGQLQARRIHLAGCKK